MRWRQRRMFGLRPFAQSLELGEDLLDRVEVGRVFGQEHEARPDGSDGLSHRLSLVGAEIVEDTTSPGLRVGVQELFDTGAEAFAVDEAVEQAGRVDAVSCAQAARNVAVFQRPCGTLPTRRCPIRRPAAQPGHVGFRPGLVDERQSPGHRCGPDRLAIARAWRLMSARSCSRGRGSFFKRHANLAKEAAHHRGVGFDPSLGRKAIAKGLKRDVRFLGPHGFQKITVRWPPCPTGSREPWRSTRRPLDRHRFADLVAPRRCAAAHLAPLHRVNHPVT